MLCPVYKLDPGPQGWPIDLEGADLDDLLDRFKRSMALAGREPESKGSGNRTRRLRLELAGGEGLGRVS